MDTLHTCFIRFVSEGGTRVVGPLVSTESLYLVGLLDEGSTVYLHTCVTSGDVFR